MPHTQLPILLGLIQCLPLPLVLFAKKSKAVIANDRFDQAFLADELGSTVLRRLARNPGSAWQEVKLRCRDGRQRVTRAQSVAVAEGSIVVFESAGRTLMQDNERLREQVTALESLSATDRLTGAWNRLQLERMVDIEISRANRTGEPVTLIWLDVDHFKRVNDVHGHLTGDRVLVEFAGRLRKRLRQSDSLFRWGGDEFVVLARSVGYRGGAALAESLRRAVAAVPFATAMPVTASLGVAEYVAGENAKSWFERADRALYTAKSAGRSRVHIDRRGGSDRHSNRTGWSVLRLHWLEAYECGDPATDAEHREMFELGNALIAAAVTQHSDPGSWRAPWDSLLAHMVRHFEAEEALMAQHGYPGRSEHQRAHAGLLRRAAELKAAVERGEIPVGHLVGFVVNDAIALHLLRVDREFNLLLRRENAGTAAGVHCDMPLEQQR